MKNKAGFVRSFVIPVKKSKLAQYKKMAKIITKIWMESGATSYIECVGEGLEFGKVTSFPRSVKLKKDEVLVLGWSTFKNRAQAEKGMEKAMSDKRLAPYMDPKKLGFDGKRMYWGGFKPFVQA